MEETEPLLPEFVLDRITVGIVIVDPNHRVLMWNRFMETHTGRAASEVVGQDLFTCFPELPRRWLSKRLEAVFLLKSYGFTSWRERPYLFRMSHNRPITGGVDCMRQDCTFLPVLGSHGGVESVCISVNDVTDTAISEQRLQEALREIEILSSYDALTGLYNRRALQDQLETEIARGHRYGNPLSLVLLDFDHFKQVNDTYGHLCGDHVLKEIAQRVTRVVREADVAARYGGEEFAVILPHASLPDARMVAERLRHAVEDKPVVWDEHEVPVTISVGVSELSEATEDAYALLGAADKALYAAKVGGRNRVVCYSESDEAGTEEGSGSAGSG
jgi:diguanylate cyclase (GGDEF)-like protein